MKASRRNNLFAVFASVALVPVIGMAVGCTKLQQDPLSGEPDSIRNGKPATEKPAPEIPQKEEVLKLDYYKTYTFREGVESEIVLNGRLLQSVNGQEGVINRDFEVFVDNMGDFPGATFDRATNTFRWKPSHVSAGDMYTEIPLIIKGATLTLQKNVSRTEEAVVIVIRSETDPQIKSVNASFPVLREGQSYDFTVTVKDPDTAASLGQAPRLFALPSGNSYNKDGSRLIKMVPGTTSAPNPVQDPQDPSLWTFKMRVETGDLELTANEDYFSASIEVMSVFGRRANQNVSFKIATTVRAPEITWRDRMSVNAGSKANVSFSVYDPKSEGRIMAVISNCSVLPGATCSCISNTGDFSMRTCTISWNVPANQTLGTYTVKVDTENESKAYTNPHKISKTFMPEIRVLAPLDPISTSEPAPVN